jgi:pyruvate,water dikinase
LVDADCAGVLFTRNPMTGADEIVIEAAWGLGETVVAGLVTPDHFRLSADGRIVEQRIGEKDIAMRRAADGGTHETSIAPELVEAPCLDTAALARLVALAREATALFGPAIDLEWAFAGGALHLLQARPITTRAP